MTWVDDLELSPVRDQGTRPTCVAFAVTATHELIRHFEGLDTPELSEEFLYWGCKQIDGDTAEGTSIGSAATALRSFGEPPAAIVPYRLADDGQRHYDPTDRATRRALDYRRDDVASSAVENALTGHLEHGRPVGLVLDLWTAFFCPGSSGAIDDPQPADHIGALHAVVVVARRSTSLVIRNSWGHEWGVDGYATLSPEAVSRATVTAWIHSEDHLDRGATATGVRERVRS